MTDREYLRTLPLLLVGGVAFCIGALIFFEKGDVTASIAAMTLGVVLVSMWAALEVMGWWRAVNRKEARGAGDAVGGVRRAGVRDGGDGVGDLPSDVDGRAAGEAERDERADGGQEGA